MQTVQEALGVLKKILKMLNQQAIGSKALLIFLDYSIEAI